MSDIKFSRRAAMFLLPAGLAGGLAGCGLNYGQYNITLPTDEPFLEMVKQAMPDFRLTSAITGRPVVRSPGFALIGIRDSSPKVAVQEFLSQFEETGLRSVTLYARNHGDSFWRVNFPGCDASSCVSTAENLNFVPVSRREFGYYHPGEPGGSFDRHTVLLAELSGVFYNATAVVGYDNRGRVIKYQVEINRAPVNAAESRWADENTSPVRVHSIELYQFSSNLALGISDFYEGAPIVRGDSSRGL